MVHLLVAYLILLGHGHGHGKMYRAKGDWYEGSFVYEARIGVGKYHWQNGCEYYGDFVGKESRYSSASYE